MADGSFPENGEGLFPIGEVTPPIPENREHDLSTPDRAAHLIEALNYYDTAATLHALAARFYTQPAWLKEQQARLGENVVYKWRRQTHERHQLSLDTAETEFRLAYPPQELETLGMSPEEAETEIARRYDNFKTTYAGSSQARVQKRQKVRQQYLEFVGQQQVDDDIKSEHSIVEAPDFPPEDPDAKVSLARALRPEFSKLDPRDYEDIPVEIVARWNPVFLRDSLVNVPPGTGNSRGSMQEVAGGVREVRTVFVPDEWSILLRSNPKYIADVAFNTAETAQRKLPPEQRDPEAPHRARIAVNLQMAETMQEHIATDLRVSLEVIARFKEAAMFNGGLARFGNEANMRDQLDFFWKVIVGDMVWATRIANNLPPAEEEHALRALEKAVHFAPTPMQRRERMVLLCDVAEEWILGRENHMEAQTVEANNYAEQERTKLARNRVAQQIPQLLL